MNIFFRKKFLECFDIIADFYKTKNSNYYVKLWQNIVTKIEMLKQFPEMCKKLPEFEENIRKMVVLDYSILYQIEGEQIYILLIFGKNLVDLDDILELQ